MNPLQLQTILAVALLAACGSSGGDNGTPGPDAGTATSVDAMPSADSGSQTNCTAAATFGAATLTEQKASGQGGSGGLFDLEARGKLNQDALPDMLSVLLYPNEGPFGDTLSTGSFPLDDKATSFATCGVCVLVDADTTGPTGVTDVYMPTAGTLEIFELYPNFRAELRGAVFRHVLIDVNTFETTDDTDGCKTAIDSVSFDAPIINE